MVGVSSHYLVIGNDGASRRTTVVIDVGGWWVPDWGLSRQWLWSQPETSGWRWGVITASLFCISSSCYLIIDRASVLAVQKPRSAFERRHPEFKIAIIGSIARTLMITYRSPLIESLWVWSTQMSLPITPSTSIIHGPRYKLQPIHIPTLYIVEVTSSRRYSKSPTPKRITDCSTSYNN